MSLGPGEKEETDGKGFERDVDDMFEPPADPSDEDTSDGEEDSKEGKGRQ